MSVVLVIWLHGRTCSGAWQIQDSRGFRRGRPFESEAKARAALWQLQSSRNQARR